jgi:GTPase SAR1 family protein
VTEAQRVNTATLIMGPTGSGKTSLLATFFRWLYETKGGVGLLYSCDGGAFPTTIQVLINQGIVRVWRMRTRSGEGLAHETFQLASKGYWPAKINARTGETEPYVKLVPPVTAKFTMTCPNDHIVKVVPVRAALTPQVCPSCKVVVNQSNMRVSEEMHRTAGFEQVAGVAFDGLTSANDWWLDDIGQRHGTMELKGEGAALGGRIVSGEIAFGGTNRADVGWAQSRSQQVVMNSLGIPFLKESPVWTALTLDTTDTGKLAICGPRIAGQARTDSVPAYFGNVFEASLTQTDEGIVRRMYLSEWFDEERRRHLCKNSGPGTLPEWIQDPPVDPTNPRKSMFSGFNLGLAFQMLDEALSEELKIRADESVPGLPADDLMTYGEGVTVTPTNPLLPPEPTPRPKPAQPAPPVEDSHGGTGALTVPAQPTATRSPSPRPSVRSASPTMRPPASAPRRQSPKE